MTARRDAPPGLDDMRRFPLLDALLGRRSRRFARGAVIPDGPFAFRSHHDPMPLDDLETLLVVLACGGNTSWHHMIHRAERYAPHLANYSAAAGGRTFPSAAGFHTSQVVFTDDSGVYLLDTRDAPAWATRAPDGRLELDELLAAARGAVKKLEDGRLKLPPEVPWVEAHNTWVVNRPGSLLVTPIGDLAQHVLLALCYMLQNGLVLYDDVNRRPIPGLAQYDDLVDPESVWPITFVEQWSVAELSAELSTSCYCGALMLQAMGLGGWMLNGIEPFSFLGASGDPRAPGLGFRHEHREGWPYPNVTGRPDAIEAFCPPRFATMREAVDAVVARKFGRGGPFHPETPGPWKDSAQIRGAAQPHDERFAQCVALQAQYVLDTFGKFPGTVPSLFVLTHLQAFHLDLDFYDTFYAPGSYLESHANHMERWHPGGEGHR
jgi:hypothetical protein